MNVFILTGAGVSAESGLGVFRGPGAAMWKRYDPMQLATPEAFVRDPALVREDVRNGYITAERAREVYGVSL